MVFFLAKSMDAASACGEVCKSLHQRRLVDSDATTLSVDGYSVNLKFLKIIESACDVSWFLNPCLSHMANNAGDCAQFVMLSQF